MSSGQRSALPLGQETHEGLKRTVSGAQRPRLSKTVLTDEKKGQANPSAEHPSNARETSRWARREREEGGEASQDTKGRCQETIKRKAPARGFLLLPGWWSLSPFAALSAPLLLTLRCWQ
jgi:hypothetical protein